MSEELGFIIEHFGGARDVLVIGLFFISFLLINSLIKNNKIRLFMSLLGSLFISFQLISLFLTQSFIGYRFYVHFNMRDVFELSGIFIPHIICAFIFIGFLLYVFYISNRLYNKKIIPVIKNKIGILTLKIILIFVVVICFFVIDKKSSFASDSRSLDVLFNIPKSSFSSVLKKYGMNDYVLPDQIQCKKGKNIIIISLESYEKAFLGKKFSSLTPHIRKLKDDWNYYNITQNKGSGWTSG